MRNMRSRVWGLALVPLFVFVGCDKTVDLGSQPAFSKFIGKTYQTKRDLVATDAKGNRADFILEEPGVLGIPPLERMKSFPYEEGGIRVIDVVPAGSILKVTNIQKFQSTE